MGTFTCQLRIDSLDGQRSLETEALVHTGAAFTMVPASQLTKLGIEPFDTVRVSLADGSIVACGLGRALATVQGRTETTLVIFGADDDVTLLGAYTLEGLRFAVDPVRGRLTELVGTL